VALRGDDPLAKGLGGLEVRPAGSGSVGSTRLQRLVTFVLRKGLHGSVGHGLHTNRGASARREGPVPAGATPTTPTFIAALLGGGVRCPVDATTTTTTGGQQREEGNGEECPASSRAPTTRQVQ